MKKREDLLDVDLRLFDGGDAGTAGESGSATGGDKAGSVGTQQRSARGEQGREAPSSDPATPGHLPPARGKAKDGETLSVTAGGKDSGSDAGGKQDDGQAETPDQRRARYKAMIEGEFKDLFTADTQRIINGRFKETRGLQEALAAQGPVMDFLMSKYQAKDPAALMAAIQADESQWQAMADAAGKTVEQFKADWFSQRQRESMERELKQSRQELFFRRQMERWEGEAAELREVYPDFDLEAEAGDKDFLSLLRSGVPMRMAYEVKHMPDIIAGAQKAAADERERAVTEAIRARGGRPAENGSGAQNGVTTGVAVSKLTREQRADIAKRAARGERITLT